MLKKTVLTVLIFILIFSFSPVIFAEANKAAVGIGDIILETENIKEAEEKENEIPEFKEEEIKVSTEKSSHRITVEKIKITGNTVFSTEELQSLVNNQKYTGSRVSFTDLQQAAAEITNYYRNRGFFVARAYVPVQQMQDNILEIRVLEGEYGSFIIKNDSLVKDQVILGILKTAAAKKIISNDSLERSMLIINDLPGLKISQTNLMPGKKVGTSDFRVKTVPTAGFNGYFTADNYGSEYTGRARISNLVNINSPFGLGDKIAFRSMLTDDQGIENFRFSYSFPLSSSGFRAELAYAETEYELGDIYSDLNIIGESDDLEINFSYPAKLSKRVSTKFLLNFKYREMLDKENNNTTADKKIKKMKLSFKHNKNYQLFKWGSQRKLDSSVTMGDLKRKPANNLFEDTAGLYSKINIKYAEKIQFNNKWSLNSSIKTQYSLGNKNLDGSEDFALGGINGVKLYPSGEHNAEEGYLLNLELLYQLPELNNYKHRLGLFYDRGYAEMADPAAGYEGRTLQDIGAGYYLNYKDFFANINLAFKIDSEKVSSEEDYDQRLLIQAGYLF